MMTVDTHEFQHCRGNKPEIHRNIEGPRILQSEVRTTINKIKRKKAKDPDDVVIKMVQALGDFGNKVN